MRNLFPRLKQTMVGVGHLAPDMPIKGNAEHDFRGWNAGLLILLNGIVGRDLLGVVLTGEQGRMVPGNCIGGRLVVVVRHQVHRINILLHLVHLGMREKLGRSAGSNGDIEPPVKLLFQLVEAHAQFFQQQRVIPLVLGAKMTFGAGQPRIFPVDVQPIELMAIHKPGHAGDEDATALSGQRHIGKCSRPQPSAHTDEHRQGGVFLLQRHQRGHVPIVVGKTIDDAATLDIGEGIVDARQFLRRYLARANRIVLRKDIGHDDSLRRGCACE